jgi:Right handed beta helix region
MITMRVILFLFSLLLGLNAEAATYWASTAGGAASCAAASGTSDPGVYRTFTQGKACLAGGDTLILKAGTYSGATVESPDIPSGTSWTAATTIMAETGATVTLQANTTVLSIYGPGSSQTRQYVIFKNIIADANNAGSAAAAIGVAGLGGSVNHIRLDGVELKNSIDSCLFLGADNAQGNFSEVVNSKIHHCGTNNLHHGIYMTASNNLIENNEFYQIHGFGVTNYCQPSGTGCAPSNNIIRRNYFHDVALHSTGSPFAVGLNVGGETTTNNEISLNIIINNGNGIVVDSNSAKVFGNSLYRNGRGFSGASCCYAAIKNTTGSSNAIKNNLLIDNQINSIDTTGSTGGDVSNNITTGSANGYLVSF